MYHLGGIVGIRISLAPIFINYGNSDVLMLGSDVAAHSLSGKSNPVLCKLYSFSLSRFKYDFVTRGASYVKDVTAIPEVVYYRSFAGIEVPVFQSVCYRLVVEAVRKNYGVSTEGIRVP